MKTQLAIAVLLAALSLDAGQLTPIPAGPNRGQIEADALSANESARRINEALNRNPWRIINGQTTHVSRAWWLFKGRVIAVQEGGLRMEGYCWPIGGSWQDASSQEFFVANFPYAAAEDDIVGQDYDVLALPAGTHTYNTVNGSQRTLHKLDFGKITSPPPPRPLTPEEKAANEKKKAEQAARTLEYHQKLAAEGDSNGLFRMGERYLKGDGVETNLLQAKIYLNRAANAGNAEAAALLAKLAAK